MTRSSWLVPTVVGGLLLAAGPSVSGQSKAENAKAVRAWSLKSGPGAPHNILPVGDVSRIEEAPFLRMPKISADYLLGEGDRLTMKVVEGGPLNDSLTNLTVSNSGDITIPYLGTVRAAGLTAEQLEETIARLFEERQLLKQPQVLVYITDYKAKPIFVLGEVDNPGEYMMSQELTLMEAILLAGGIDPTAGSFAYLHRRPPGAGLSSRPPVPQDPTVGEPGVEIVKIDLRPLKTGGVPQPDILLRKGDLLLVPKSRDMRFFVVGDVKAPGPQEIPPPPERAMGVAQAIAQAGGPNRTAKMSAGLLVRYSERNGSREAKKVDFLAILKGTQPDFEVLPNDIIFIPSSKGKSLAYGILGALPTTAEQKAGTAIRDK